MNIIKYEDIDSQIRCSMNYISGLDFSDYRCFSILRLLKDEDIPKVLEALHVIKHCIVTEISPWLLTAKLSNGEVIPIDYLGYAEKLFLLSECAVLYDYPVYFMRVYRILSDISLAKYIQRYKTSTQINLVVKDVYDEILLESCEEEG